MSTTAVRIAPAAEGPADVVGGDRLVLDVSSATDLGPATAALDQHIGGAR